MSLSACGGGGNDSAPEDHTAPTIANLKVTPSIPIAANALDDVTIQVEFSEAIDQNSFVKAAVLTNNSAIAPTNLINSADITFLAVPPTAVIRPKNLDEGQTYNLLINTELTDLAGNRLKNKKEVNGFLSTANSYKITAHVSDLAVGASLVLDTGAYNRAGKLIPATTITQNGDAVVATGLLTDTPYKITPTTSGGQFCSADYNEGVVTNNVNIEVVCGDVVPRYTAGKQWNDYVLASDTHQECPLGSASAKGYRACLHGGERRMWKVPGATDCSAIATIADDIPFNNQTGAFEWMCEKLPNNDIIVSSTRLKDEARLVDLIHFYSAAQPYWGWAKATVMVTFKNGQNAQSNMARWWGNPVKGAEDLVRNSTANVSNSVWVADNNAVYPVTWALLKPEKTAFAVKRGIRMYLLRTTGRGDAIELGNNFHWLEGDFDIQRGTEPTAGPVAGLWIPGQFNVVRHVDIREGNGPSRGIYVTNDNNYFKDVRVSNSGHAGFYIVGNHNTLRDIALGYNGAAWRNSNPALTNSDRAGLFIEGAYNSVAGINSTGNMGNGVLLSCKNETPITNNSVNMGTLSSNALAGIEIDQSRGCNSNTLIGITSSHNDGEGILLNGKSQVVRHVTTALNNKKGIADGANGANISNALSAFDKDTTAISGVTTAIANQTRGLLEKTDPDIYKGDIWWRHITGLSQGWGGTTHPLSTSPLTADAGACGTTHPYYCARWDWSLTLETGTASNPALNVNTSLDNNGVIINAIEILDDGIGNDDGICDLGETCIIAPNVGSYQGHGQLQDGPTTTGYTLKKYLSNGY
ncbi:MAG: Ig-like domain-containing protein [Pseudomonadota bacterium]